MKYSFISNPPRDYHSIKLEDYLNVGGIQSQALWLYLQHTAPLLNPYRYIVRPLTRASYLIEITLQFLSFCLNILANDLITL